MAENITRLVLRVEDEQGDQEGLAELTDGLRQELLDLDVDSVEQLSAGEAPPGSRAFDVASLGTLVVTVARSEVLAAIVSAVAMWLTSRRNQVVKIDVDGDVLELGGLPSQERQRLTEEWLRRRAPEASPLTGTRSALIIAGRAYQDPGLGQLRSPAHDAEALARVLGDPMIGGFDVTTLLDAASYEVSEAVEDFFADRSPDDLLLMHFSCHGVKDEGGELYFATSNTKLRRLGATAVAAEFVNRRMNRSRSRRIVLLLDCCYAGAFERGMTARAGTTMNIEEQFGGRGRAVITASSSMEYAFEGDRLTDAHELAPSVFTSALVEGLDTGEADRDQDGQVSLDELYDYVYDKVRVVTPNQTPGKWTFGVQGDIYVARRARPVTQPVPLPSELQQAIDHPLAAIRVGAVQELTRLTRGQHAGLALAARLALEHLAEDDSRAVIAAATEALAAGPTQQAGQPDPQTRIPEQGAAPQTGATPGREPAVHPTQVPPQPTPAEPLTARTLRHHPGLTTPTTRSRRRWWPGTTRGRVMVAALAVAALLVAGVVTWKILDQAAHSTTIQASFDGQWQGTATTNRDSGAVFTATLGKDLHLGRLASGASSCYEGQLTVQDATDSRLTMRFAPGNQTCNSWTVVFTHLPGGDLKMAVDPDSSVNYEQEFEVRMTRQG